MNMLTKLGKPIPIEKISSRKYTVKQLRSIFLLRQIAVTANGYYVIVMSIYNM